MTVRELNGWTPSTVTFGADGEVLSVTVSEPRFTAYERQLLLLSRRRDAEPRGRHGHLLSEATDPANQYSWSVPISTVDFAQAALNKAQKEFQDQWGERADMSSRLWRVEKAD